MKKRVFALLLVIVFTSMSLGFAYVNAEFEAVDGLQDLPPDGNEPIPATWPDEPGRMPELIGGRIDDQPIVYSLPSSEEMDSPSAQSDAPVIDVWYNTPLKFGQIGNPQEWVNVLGSIPNADANTTLTYKLNTDPELPLSVGSDGKRLAGNGDYNVEIAYSKLNPGNNTVVLKASDGVVSPTQKTVTINYTTGQTWPKNYDAVWSSSTNIHDIAQPVDGYWQLDGNSTFIDADNYGYDRLLAIGDETWKDYEVTVPITVFGLDPEGMKTNGNGAGVGFIMRWLGHTNLSGEQPSIDWARSGAVGWYRWNWNLTKGLELRGKNWRQPVNTSKVIEWGTTYILKMSVQSVPDRTAYYRLKLWKEGEPEPLEWDNQGYSSEESSTAGSLLLVAHHVDAKFGQVKVRALEDMRFTVNVTVNGEGTIVLNPEQEDYAYSDKVRVAARPADGYDFGGWTGDYVGMENPANLNVFKDMNLTANFVPKQPTKLTVNTQGEGTVSKNPDKAEYNWGEMVELTAAPATDYFFHSWDGDITGIENPKPIQMDTDKQVTAIFKHVSEASPESDDFSQCVLNTNKWALINPVGDASFEMTGTTARFNVPAGSAHNMWEDEKDALRIMQTTENVSFEIEAKFEDLPTDQEQMQGILIEQDDTNWLRFDVFYRKGNLVVNAGETIDGSGKNLGSPIVIDPGTSTQVFLRLDRNGDTWNGSYSFDGNTWTTAKTFIRSLEVTATGVFVGNTMATSADYVADVDYFFNTLWPIDPEDEGNTIDVDVVGQGQVQVTPLKQEYACGENVTLTATPANDEWLFAGWSGDFSSTQNPATLTVQGDYVITATFSQGLDVFLPLIIGD